MRFIEENISKVLFSTEQINQRCIELATMIDKDYEGKTPILLSILKGSLPFLIKLSENIKIPMEIECLKCSSYEGTSSTGSLKVADFDFSKLTNRHVIIVEDIVDTGLTMLKLKDMLSEHHVASLEIATLLDKKVKERTFAIKYVGFDCPNEFVVGFGLDYNQLYRNLPYIGVLKPSAI